MYIIFYSCSQSFFYVMCTCWAKPFISIGLMIIKRAFTWQRKNNMMNMFYFRRFLKPELSNIIYLVWMSFEIPSRFYAPELLIYLANFFKVYLRHMRMYCTWWNVPMGHLNSQSTQGFRRAPVSMTTYST